MKILVTGANGFIGKNLTNFLKERHCVFSPPKSEIDLTNEISVANYFAQKTFDVVIHCANHDGVTNYTSKDRNDIIYKNLLMFFNLFKNRYRYCKLINLGSGAEYGRRFWTYKMQETFFEQHIPEDPYGFSKFIISNFIDSYKKDFINLRFFGVYGPYEDWKTKFISNACCRNIFEIPIYIHQDKLMNFVWIYDACKIIEKFLDSDFNYNNYNICSDVDISLSCIANIITTSYKKSDIKVLNGGMGDSYSGDITRLREVIGKKFIFTNIYDGIKILYKWYEDHLTNEDYIFLKTQNGQFSRN